METEQIRDTIGTLLQDIPKNVQIAMRISENPLDMIVYENANNAFANIQAALPTDFAGLALTNTYSFPNFSFDLPFGVVNINNLNSLAEEVFNKTKRIGTEMNLKIEQPIIVEVGDPHLSLILPHLLVPGLTAGLLGPQFTFYQPKALGLLTKVLIIPNLSHPSIQQLENPGH